MRSISNNSLANEQIDVNKIVKSRIEEVDRLQNVLAALQNRPEEELDESDSYDELDEQLYDEQLIDTMDDSFDDDDEQSYDEQSYDEQLYDEQLIDTMDDSFEDDDEQVLDADDTYYLDEESFDEDSLEEDSFDEGEQFSSDTYAKEELDNSDTIIETDRASIADDTAVESEEQEEILDSTCIEDDGFEEDTFTDDYDTAYDEIESEENTLLDSNNEVVDYDEPISEDDLREDDGFEDYSEDDILEDDGFEDYSEDDILEDDGFEDDLNADVLEDDGFAYYSEDDVLEDDGFEDYSEDDNQSNENQDTEQCNETIELSNNTYQESAVDLQRSNIEIESDTQSSLLSSASSESNIADKKSKKFAEEYRKIEKSIDRRLNSDNSFEKSELEGEYSNKDEDLFNAKNSSNVDTEIEVGFNEDFDAEELDFSILDEVPVIESTDSTDNTKQLEEENARLRKQLAELENEKLKQQIQSKKEEIKLSTPGVIPTHNSKENTLTKSEQQKSNSSNDDVQKQRWSKYAALSTRDLWKYVYRFMQMAGVEKAPVKAKLLFDEFGTRNIKRLEATYIMATKDGYTC